MKYRRSWMALGGLVAMAGLIPPAVMAQDQIFRCGNEYTNNVSDAKARGCKQVAGGNVTVVQTTKQAPAGGGAKVASAGPVASSGGPRVEASEQRARDSDARAILESELKRAEARLAELGKEYNNGTPDKRGDESRNHQKYLDRVAELKASLARAESDVAGIKRELSRLPGAR